MILFAMKNVGLEGGDQIEEFSEKKKEQEILDSSRIKIGVRVKRS
jgi:hypothetical protein